MTSRIIILHIVKDMFRYVFWKMAPENDHHKLLSNSNDSMEIQKTRLNFLWNIMINASNKNVHDNHRHYLIKYICEILRGRIGYLKIVFWRAKACSVRVNW